jgi:hypothetical protein
MILFLVTLLDTGYTGLEPHATVAMQVTGARSTLLRCIFKRIELFSVLGQGRENEVALGRLCLPSACPF